MHTADDDSVPVPHGAFKLPRAVLNWKTPPARGFAPRPQRDELASDETDVTRVDPRSGSRTSVRASNDELDDEPTRAIQIPILPPTPERSAALQVLLARGASHLDTAVARAAELWRDGPLRTAAIVGGAVLITYLAVGGMRRGSDNRSQTVLAPAPALPISAPIIVEQLNGARQPRETAAARRQGEQSDKPGKKSTGSRARATSIAIAPASKSKGLPAVTSAPSKPKSSRAGRSSPAVSSSPAGLPAWGAEAVRDFSGAKSSAGANVTSRSQALSAKPTASNADIPPPMSAYRSNAREQPKDAPVVAGKSAVPPKPAEPAKPAAPARPSKPLTMDQVLNQVEEAAQAQRKQAGLKAPAAGKHDAELDALINGAMKSKTKTK